MIPRQSCSAPTSVSIQVVHKRLVNETRCGVPLSPLGLSVPHVEPLCLHWCVGGGVPLPRYHPRPDPFRAPDQGGFSLGGRSTPVLPCDKGRFLHRTCVRVSTSFVPKDSVSLSCPPPQTFSVRFPLSRGTASRSRYLWKPSPDPRRSLPSTLRYKRPTPLDRRREPRDFRQHPLSPEGKSDGRPFWARLPVGKGTI